MELTPEIQEQLEGDQLLRYNGITGKFSEVDARELDEAIDSSLAMGDELGGQYDLAAAFPATSKRVFFVEQSLSEVVVSEVVVSEPNPEFTQVEQLSSTVPNLAAIQPVEQLSLTVSNVLEAALELRGAGELLGQQFYIEEELLGQQFYIGEELLGQQFYTGEETVGTTVYI